MQSSTRVSGMSAGGATPTQTGAASADAFGAAQGRAMQTTADTASSMIKTAQDKKDTEDLVYYSSKLEADMAKENAAVEQFDESGNPVDPDLYNRSRGEVLREKADNLIGQYSQQGASARVLKRLQDDAAPRYEARGYEYDAKREATKSVRKVVGSVEMANQAFLSKLAAGEDLNTVSAEYTGKLSLLEGSTLAGENQALYSAIRSSKKAGLSLGFEQLLATGQRGNAVALRGIAAKHMDVEDVVRLDEKLTAFDKARRTAYDNAANDMATNPTSFSTEKLDALDNQVQEAINDGTYDQAQADAVSSKIGTLFQLNKIYEGSESKTVAESSMAAIRARAVATGDSQLATTLDNHINALKNISDAKFYTSYTRAGKEAVARIQSIKVPVGGDGKYNNTMYQALLQKEMDAVYESVAGVQNTPDGKEQGGSSVKYEEARDRVSEVLSATVEPSLADIPEGNTEVIADRFMSIMAAGGQDNRFVGIGKSAIMKALASSKKDAQGISDLERKVGPLAIAFSQQFGPSVDRSVYESAIAMSTAEASGDLELAGNVQKTQSIARSLGASISLDQQKNGFTTSDLLKLVRSKSYNIPHAADFYDSIQSQSGLWGGDANLANRAMAALDKASLSAIVSAHDNKSPLSSNEIIKSRFDNLGVSYVGDGLWVDNAYVPNVGSVIGKSGAFSVGAGLLSSNDPKKSFITESLGNAFKNSAKRSFTGRLANSVSDLGTFSVGVPRFVATGAVNETIGNVIRGAVMPMGVDTTPGILASMNGFQLNITNDFGNHTGYEDTSLAAINIEKGVSEGKYILDTVELPSSDKSRDKAGRITDTIDILANAAVNKSLHKEAIGYDKNGEAICAFFVTDTRNSGKKIYLKDNEAGTVATFRASEFFETGGRAVPGMHSQDTVETMLRMKQAFVRANIGPKKDSYLSRTLYELGDHGLGGKTLPYAGKTVTTAIDKAVK